MKVIFKNTTAVNSLNLKYLCSKDELRPAFSGIYIDLKNDCMVATDAHKLVVYPIEMVQKDDVPEDKQGFIVPIRFFEEKRYMMDIPPKSKRVLELDYILTDDYAEVYFLGELVFRCKYIQANFPDYEKILPSEKDKVQLDQIGISMKRVSELTKAIPNDGLNNYKLSFFGQNKAILLESLNLDLNRPIKAILMPIMLQN